MVYAMEYAVLTTVVERLEHHTGSAVTHALFSLQGNHRLQVPQGCGKTVLSTLESQRNNFGSLRLKYTADSEPLIDDSRLNKKSHTEVNALDHSVGLDSSCLLLPSDCLHKALWAKCSLWPASW